ncbi:uncharacterized protein [Linepithema humile]|uniref:uncharacterized protein n=1 Tax=Linepithema humile TaxID=83485 RepID=UPI00351E44FE
MVGQAYDGASVMSGGKNGVHILLRKAISQESQQAFAPYVHCPPHQLNLVLNHAAEKCASIQTLCFFGNVQKCYGFFADSPQRRWAMLQETCMDDRGFTEIEEDEGQLLPQKEKILTLKSLSDIKWSARTKATHALLQNFQSVIICLEQIVELKHDQEEVTTAAGLLNSFSFKFLVTLIFWNDVLQIVDITSKLLQKKEIDLFQVKSSSSVLHETI